LERTQWWVAFSQARPILCRFRLPYRDDIRGSKQTGVLLLNLSPKRIGLFPDTLFRHQLARHCRQYVVIVIESLQALICELALHGE
jgi:hypothetical protein